MLIVSKYDLEPSSDPQVFLVRSAEIVPCPCCQSTLSSIGRRVRIWILGSGEIRYLKIRRLRCKRASCRRIHHELPNCLIPYKRYGAASIEQALGDAPITVAADNSTLYRWRRWFSAWAAYAAGCLASIAYRFGLSVTSFSSSPAPQTVLQHVERFVGNLPGWLSRSVRSIVNDHSWVTHPFGIPVRFSSG